jgi:predicted RNA-binding protein with EMAP domain
MCVVEMQDANNKRIVVVSSRERKIYSLISEGVFLGSSQLLGERRELESVEERGNMVTWKLCIHA